MRTVTSLTGKLLGAAYPATDLVVLFALVITFGRPLKNPAGSSLRRWHWASSCFWPLIWDSLIDARAGLCTGSAPDHGWAWGFCPHWPCWIPASRLANRFRPTRTRRRPRRLAPGSAAPPARVSRGLGHRARRRTQRNDRYRPAWFVRSGRAHALISSVHVLWDNVVLNRRLEESARPNAGPRRGASRQVSTAAELRRLTAILDATPDLVATMSLDGEVHYLNEAAKRTLGLPAHVDPQLVESAAGLPHCERARREGSRRHCISDRPVGRRVGCRVARW